MSSSDESVDSSGQEDMSDGEERVGQHFKSRKARLIQGKREKGKSQHVAFVSSRGGDGIFVEKRESNLQMDVEHDITGQQFSEIMTGLGANKKSNGDFRDLVRSEHANKEKIQKPLSGKVVSTQALPADIGAWQKHTKGIGLKLLQKMGFTGRLGAKEDGIERPVAVTSHQSGEGLGFTEIKTKKSHQLGGMSHQRAEEQADKLERQQNVESLSRTKSWKKGKVEIAAPKVLEVSDLLGSSQPTETSRSQVILDMRGEEVRVLHSMSEIGTSASMSFSKNASSPKLGQELLYNINLIADLIEAEATNCSNSFSIETKRVHSLRVETEALDKELALELPKLDRMENLSKALGKIQSKMNTDPGSVTLDAIVNAMKTLHGAFIEEFKLFGIIHLLTSLISPIVQAILSGWDPMLDPTRLAEIVVELNPLADYFVEHGQSTVANHVNVIIEGTIKSHAISVINRSITNSWEPTHPDNCITLINAMQKVLHPSSINSIFESMVKPKIKMAIIAWNGVGTLARSSLPIHVWFLPWMPFFREQLSELFPDIRRKLSQFLKSSNNSDESAILLIYPWIDVFDSNSVQELFVRAVIPRLIDSLQRLNFEPAVQDWERKIFLSVMLWHDVVPKLIFSCLLEGEFFARWLNALVGMINNFQDFAKVVEWYSGWRNIFPNSLLESDPKVRASLNVALDVMNESMKIDGDLPLALVESSSFEVAYAMRKHECKFSGMLSTIYAQAHVTLNMKDLVAKEAERLGTEFVLVQGRSIEGHQYFQFGKVVLYFAQDIVFARSSQDSQFHAMSLSELSLVAL